MTQIAICDDSNTDRQTLKKMLESYFAKHSQPLKIHEYRNGSTLADDYADGLPLYQMIFLDIFLLDSHGMNIARTIRTYDSDVKIIFFTSSADFAIDSYDVAAFQYLVKPVHPEKLYHTIDRFFYYSNQNKSPCLLVKNGHQTECISYSEILYIESKNSFVIIHTRNAAQFRLYLKLSEVGNMLEQAPFLRCHQSYIVNLNYIRSVHKVFILENGMEIPIRRQNVKQIKELYFDYVIRTTL